MYAPHSLLHSHTCPDPSSCIPAPTPKAHSHKRVSIEVLLCDKVSLNYKIYFSQFIVAFQGFLRFIAGNFPTFNLSCFVCCMKMMCLCWWYWQRHRHRWFCPSMMMCVYVYVCVWMCVCVWRVRNIKMQSFYFCISEENLDIKSCAKWFVRVEWIWLWLIGWLTA